MSTSWNVMLCKPGVSWPPIVTAEILTPTFHRAVEYRNAGIFIEVYRVTHYADHHASADFVRLERPSPLARHFDPARLR